MKYVIFLQTFCFLIFLSACGAKDEPAAPLKTVQQSGTRPQIQVTIKKGESEWSLQRSLEVTAEGYRLSDPITLPVENPDEIILSKGTSQLARLRWDPKSRDRLITPLYDRSLKLEFRSLPEKMKFEWVQKDSVPPLANGKILIGGLRIKNFLKDSITIKHSSLGWARVGQEEWDWRMTETDPCFHRSEHTTKESFYDLQVDLGADVTLKPDEERLIPVFAFGESAKLLQEWRLPVTGPDHYIRENLFLGYIKDYPNGFPPGGVFACTTAFVVTKPYDFPIGIERRSPALSFSSELRKVRVSYRGDESVFSAQELPKVENFLGFTN
jgi:hypothetical protein